MPKQLFLALFLLFFCLRGFSAVFVVTSNADSGPGTLRDALTQAAANGNTEKDYINFNLPDLSEAGRTITILTQLPDVSSNLVIDGSTQTGNKFGISDAKICLLFEPPGDQPFSGLRVVEQTDVEIYGLYIKNTTDLSTNTTNYFWKGIELKNDKNIQLGAAGKGNVMFGFYVPISVNYPDNTNEHFENLTLKDNFIGIDVDGETLSVNQTEYFLIYSFVGNINIGGTASEGNLIPEGMELYQVNNVDSTNPNDYYVSTPATINIKNNKIGTDYSVTKTIPTSSGLSIETVQPGGKDTYEIDDNVIVNEIGSSSIFIANNGYSINIKRNYIGIDKTLQHKLSNLGGIFIMWSDKINIGSSNPADANYITGCKPVDVDDYATASVNKNSFFCTVNEYPMVNNYFTRPVTQIAILNITPNSMSGTATPNSSVELFYSDVCNTCSPQTYFASTTAGADGKWIYNGAITSPVIASATINNSTSNFTRTTVDSSNIKITNVCSSNGFGSITGAVPYSFTSIKWVDGTGKIVGTKPDLLDVKIGKYKLIVQNESGCADSTSYYEIKNNFSIDTTNIKKTNPSCGKTTGAVTGLNVINNNSGSVNLTWKDAAGKTWSNTADLQSVPAGSYSLIIANADNTCTTTYGPITLKNTTGPNIDQTNQIIKPTNCGQSIGSITNLTITGTGTLKYVWLNDQQQQVGTDKDLINQPAGTYKLQVTDDTQCGPVYSTDIAIPETNGITMDESKVQVTNALCGGTGSITGIQVTGASSYKWTDANNHTLITTTPDVGALAPGSYTLTAANSYGCSKSSAVYIISQPTSFPWPDYTATYTKACNLLNNGGVSVATDNLVVSARWVDAQSTTVGTGSSLSNVLAGTYQLYLTDHNGCEKLYKSYTVEEYPEFTVAAPPATITADECGLHNGSVGATTIAGGIPPYIYTWRDASGKTLGTTNILTNLAAGTYILNVTDNGCGSVDITYTVQEQTTVPDAPSVSPVQLCSSGSGVLTVNNPSANTTYRLYTSQSGGQPVDEQKGGRFTINIANSTSYYVSELEGTCESSRAEIPVTVGVGSTDIANAFTPNGDGINDYWQIKNIQNYASATVQVFNRYGQLLFESKGYARPWDGTYNGQKLPAGVYYYIINLNTRCNILSGSLTLIR